MKRNGYFIHMLIIMYTNFGLWHTNEENNLQRCEKMKKNTRLLIIFVLTFMIIIGSNCYAACWGTPGYEWALSRGLTSIKTQSQLSRDVTLSD